MDEEGSPQHSAPDAAQEHRTEPQAERSPTEAVASTLAAQEALARLSGCERTRSDPATRVLDRVSSRSDEAGGSVPEQSPQDREAMLAAKERGNQLSKAEEYKKAAAAYTEALRYARDPDDVASLLADRSAAYASLSRMYRSRPARRSEYYGALFDLDPTSLAQLALKDADKAVGLKPGWAEGHLRQGTALFLLERYLDAREAFLEGLALEPTSASLQGGLREVQAMLGADDDGGAGANAGGPAAGGAGAEGASGGEAAAAAAAPGSSFPAGSGSKRQRSLSLAAGRSALDDWDCALCAKLLFEPVTTPCGHTFCRECFARAIDHKPRCPYCRTVLHVARDAIPITITLANIISRAFPEEYEERRREAAGAAAGLGGGADAGGGGGGAPLTLPLFVMSLLMPGESMALNIFEPRYRLMVRRVMEGSRRLGMAQARPDHQEIEDVAVEAEILDCQPQPDGRYYLELVGRRRVRIASHSELDGYRVARCEPLQDSDPQPGTPAYDNLPELVRQVEQQLDQVLSRIRGLASAPGDIGHRARFMLDGLGERPPAAQAERFSFWAASVACLLLRNLDKVALLRCTDTGQRLGMLQDRLQARMAAGGTQACSIM